MKLSIIREIQQLAGEIIRSTQPNSPIANGDLFQIGTFGYDMFDTEITWGSVDFAANFLPHNASLYSSPERGTVNQVKPLTLRRQNIHRYSCSVILDQITDKVWKRAGFLDPYEEQITAKVEGFNELITNGLLYGIQDQGIPGLLNGSGIPTVIEPLNISAAVPDVVISTLYKQITGVAVSSAFRHVPNIIGLPSDLVVLLNSISIGGGNDRSVYSVLQERLAIPLSNNQQPFSLVSEPSFNAAKIMTVLSDNPKDLCGVVFDLQEEEECQESIASLHVGGFGGVVVKRPEASRIIRLTY